MNVHTTSTQTEQETQVPTGDKIFPSFGCLCRAKFVLKNKRVELFSVLACFPLAMLPHQSFTTACFNYNFKH